MENLMSIHKVSQFHNEDELLVNKAYFSYFFPHDVWEAQKRGCG
jgi:hypothetical protein